MRSESKVTILKSDPLSLKEYLIKVWEFRSMIIALTMRDLKVRYAQTFLGVLWAIIQPLIGLLIFTFFFTRIIKLESPLPYPLIALSGLAAWYFFSNIIQSASLSLVQAQSLIRKVYFPRLILLISKIIPGLIDLTISVCLLLGLMVILGINLQPQILCFPIFVVLTIVLGLTISLWLSSLSLRYRDFHHVVPYVLNYGIWLTPVFFPTTIIPEQYSWLLFLNPMAAIIAGYRWSLIGDVFPVWEYWLSFIPILILLISGLNYFRKNEYKISDFI